MSRWAESFGLAVVAVVVVGGLLVYAKFTTDSRRKQAELEQQKTQEALRSAEQVPNLRATVPAAAAPVVAAAPKPSTAPTVSAPKRPIPVVANKGARPATPPGGDAPLPGLVVPGDETKPAGPNEPSPDADALARERELAAVPLIPPHLLEGPPKAAAGGVGTTDVVEEDEEGDAAVAAEEPPTPGALPKPGSKEELVVMEDVQKHLRNLHNLLLRTDIPPAAREAELKRLEAAMDRLSPQTRRSMNALVEQGYTARVRGANQADTLDQRAANGEALDQNALGQKDTTPSDVKALEQKIARTRAKLGITTPRPKRPATAPSSNPTRLPTSAPSRLKATGTGAGTLPTGAGNGGIPATKANNL